MYVKREVAHLTVGDEFVDAADITNVVTGFTFGTSPAFVTVHTDLYPAGRDMRTTDVVWQFVHSDRYKAARFGGRLLLDEPGR